MAGKMDPEDAFRLIGNRGKGVKTRSGGRTIEDIDVEGQMDATSVDSPKWVRYTIITVTAIISIGFIILLSRGTFLLIDKKEPTPREISQEVPLVTFTDTETKELIEVRLKSFLACSDTQQRLEHVLTPKAEEQAMLDYYEKRGNLDVALWKIELVKSASLGGARIWMVAYLDVSKRLHYVRFERSGNSFYIQWSSSYGYGEFPWNEFARTQPREPSQMRCYVLRYTGTLPPGIDPAVYEVFVIENQRGEFTATAIMHRDAEGFLQLASLPKGSRNPVNLELKYSDLPNGTHQLTITQLIHFQWHQNSITDKGRPVALPR